MKCTTWMLAVLSGTLVWSCGSMDEHRSSISNTDRPVNASALADDDDDGDDDGDEETIGADEIPAAVKSAAAAAVPGFVAEEAEKESEDGALIYCVHGMAGGTFYEIEVSADGSEIIDIESGPEDEGDDGDDD